MNPYNPEATCPKCGGKDIGTGYEKTDAVWENKHDRVNGEHLDRICRNCGYVWPEMCLDDPSITSEELAKFLKRWSEPGIEPRDFYGRGIEWGLPPSPAGTLTNTPRPLTETALDEFMARWRGDAPDF